MAEARPALLRLWGASLMESLPVLRHHFSGCPCGHSEHVARGFLDKPYTQCLVCEDLLTSYRADDAFAELTVESAARIDVLGLVSGALVRYDGELTQISNLQPIVKLEGYYDTGFVRVLMRRIRPAVAHDNGQATT